ncbi:hypothetical protein ACFVIL_29260 [Streptomyces sp. NPDC127159]|uniref:hypothetical protein n=1 Tax=unclassified Streptomyces TaxID=2593676 RepID=UPI00363D9F49
MSGMTRPHDVAYLLPLFEAVTPYRADGYFRPLPEPAVRSSLATDDAPLKPWHGSVLIRTSFSAGLSHVDALCRLVTMTGLIDPSSPWTLLRGALENFATAAWLLSGKDRPTRRARALALWAEDMRNRAQHEKDVQHVVTGNGKTGEQRQQDIKQLAMTLGLNPLPATQAGAIIAAAAEQAGLDSVGVRASWRVASGFAHGRFWPNLRAAEPRSAIPTADGYLIAMVIDDAQLERLAKACLWLLGHVAQRYAARCTVH